MAKKEGLLLDSTVYGIRQTKTLVAIELFSDCPNMLRNDVRVALVIDFSDLGPGEMDDPTFVEQATTYLHGTGFDFDLEKGSQESDERSGDGGIAADVDSITKYTIGATVSFDGSDLISHELCVDILANDVNFAIKKVVKLIRSYCRDDVQVVRTRIIREKHYIAQNTDNDKNVWL